MKIKVINELKGVELLGAHNNMQINLMNIYFLWDLSFYQYVILINLWLRNISLKFVID